MGIWTLLRFWYHFGPSGSASLRVPISFQGFSCPSWFHTSVRNTLPLLSRSKITCFGIGRSPSRLYWGVAKRSTSLGLFSGPNTWIPIRLSIRMQYKVNWLSDLGMGAVVSVASLHFLSAAFHLCLATSPTRPFLFSRTISSVARVCWARLIKVKWPSPPAFLFECKPCMEHD